MHKLLFIHKILHSSTCFEPYMLIFRRSHCIYAAYDTVTLYEGSWCPVGTQIEWELTFSQFSLNYVFFFHNNLCSNYLCINVLHSIYADHVFKPKDCSAAFSLCSSSPDQIIFGCSGTVFILCPVPSVSLHLKILCVFCFRTLFVL